MRLRRPNPPQLVMPVHRRSNARPYKPASPRPWPIARMSFLLLALAMFGQTFQYLIDVKPLYALSKIWPILTIPAAVIGFRQPDAPYKKLTLVTLVWVWAIGPVMGILQLGNSITDSLATTVKAWCFLFPFSCFGFLVWLRPSPRSLRRAILGLGIVTFVALTLIWVLVPFSVYDAAGADTKLFMYDDERGYHLFMPLMFGLIVLFYLNRSFWTRPHIWQPACIVAILAIMIIVYKERATLGGAAVICAWGMLDSVRSKMRSGVFAVSAVIGTALGFLLVFHLQTADLSHSGLGGSLSIRQNSIASALDFLSADPLRWIFGVGSISRVGDNSLGALVHNNAFFLDDIGWLGVVFEYGAIGATLIALLHMAAIQQTRRAITPNDTVAQAISDYVLYVMLVSPVYSVMFTPGEALTCFALATYFIRERTAAAKARAVQVS